MDGALHEATPMACGLQELMVIPMHRASPIPVRRRGKDIGTLTV